MLRDEMCATRCSRCSTSCARPPLAEPRPAPCQPRVAKSLKLRPDQLAAHLSKELLPLYVVSGEEPLQREECVDAIRAAARSRQFEEREVLHVDRRFDWSELTGFGDSLSLFATRRILELRIPEQAGRRRDARRWRPGASGRRRTCCWCSSWRSGSTVRWPGPSGSPPSKRAGAHVQVWPVAPREMNRWVMAAGHGRRADPGCRRGGAAGRAGRGQPAGRQPRKSRSSRCCTGARPSAWTTCWPPPRTAPATTPSTWWTRASAAMHRARCGWCARCARKAYRLPEVLGPARLGHAQRRRNRPRHRRRHAPGSGAGTAPRRVARPRPQARAWKRCWRATRRAAGRGCCAAPGTSTAAPRATAGA